MIKKLEPIIHIEIESDLRDISYERLPDNKEIMDKINEIIEVINKL